MYTYIHVDVPSPLRSHPESLGLGSPCLFPMFYDVKSDPDVRGVCYQIRFRVFRVYAIKLDFGLYHFGDRIRFPI